MPSTKGLRAAGTGPTYFLALVALAAPGVSAAETGSFQRTVADIMTSPGTPAPASAPRPAVRLTAPRRDLALPADSPRAARAPVNAVRTAVMSPDAPSAPQTPGVNFLGTTLAQAGVFPPDTAGAAGPTQFLLGVNGRIRSFAKATGVADGVLDATMDTFFTTVRNGSATFFPQVRYDRLSARWIVTINTAGDSFVNNRILIAVTDAASNGILSNATVWTFFYFQ